MFQVNFIKQNNFNNGKEITKSFSYKSKYATVMDNIAIYLKMSFCQNIQISMSVFTRRKKCKNVNHIYFFILIHNYIHLKILFVQRTVLHIIFKFSMNNFSPDCEFWNGHSIILYTSVILESVFSVHKTLDYYRCHSKRTFAHIALWNYLWNVRNLFIPWIVVFKFWRN